MWKNIKKVVGSVAPFLGTMIGGPFGAMAGRAIKQLLIGDENASDKDLEAALLGASPEQLVQLRQLDVDFKTKMAQLGLDEQKIAALDRKSARGREMEIRDHIPATLAIMLTLGFFGVLAALMFVDIPPSSRSVIDVMLGSLGTAWIAAITYYFGSSYGSRVKTVLSKQGD